ncbi:MAG: hypothetical protein IH995_02210 [Proteobacteria bacterium]|nr:hypothetical protein [Pseudomonadota bacterium]
MNIFTRKTASFKEVLKEEQAYLEEFHTNWKKGKSSGIACSGGGIRSASFSTGIMQALYNEKILKKFSYLSTVSGGGFCGAALTWFQLQYKTFPFGDKDSFKGSHVFDEEKARIAIAEAKPGDKSLSNCILSYIRQHGNYLTPYELGKASFIGRVLLSILNSATAYLLFFGLFFLLLLLVTNMEFIYKSTWIVWGLFEIEPEIIKIILKSWGAETIKKINLNFSALFGLLATLSLGIYLVIVLLYGVFTVRFSGTGRGYCLRVGVQKLMGWLLIIFVVSLILFILPVGFQFLFGKGIGGEDSIALGLGLTVAPTILGMLLALYKFQKGLSEKSALQGPVTSVILSIAVVALIFAILTLGFLIGSWAFEGNTIACAALLFGGFLLLAVNLNLISPHRLYRDRLMETFMWDPDTDPEGKLCRRGAAANKAKLSEMITTDKKNWSPYHILNTNLVLTDAKRPKNRGRHGDNFILSPKYCGSSATDYVKTKDFIANRLTLATAMATSGAAANPNAGVSGKGLTTNPLVSFLMTFCGLRLGLWTINPNQQLNAIHQIWPPNYIWPGIFSLLAYGQRENSRRIELSDGGHFDNTGLYELVRRGVRTIVLCDGSADPDYTFDDLGNVIERVRVDFGVQIYFPIEKPKKGTAKNIEKDLDGLLPNSLAAPQGNQAAKVFTEKYSLAQRGVAIGEIVYPGKKDGKEIKGRLFYIKATIVDNLPSDIYAYKGANPDFPNQSTADQFFDERQFEAYRELGYQLAKPWVKEIAREI